MQAVVDYFCRSSDRENKQVFLEMIKPLGGKALDLGCGDGDFSLEVGKKAHATQIFGVEISSKKAKIAGKKGIKVLRADLNEKLAYEDEMFDTVTANQVIEHLYWTDSFTEEIKRVTKNDGQIILSTTNLAALHYRLQLLIGQTPICLHPAKLQFGNFLKGEVNPFFGHKSVFTYRAFLEFLKYHDFLIERSQTVSLYPLPISVSKLVLKFFPNFGVFTTVRVRKARQ